MDEFPYVLVMEELQEVGMNFQDWVDKNSRIMDELVLEGAYFLQDGEYDSITLIEIYAEDDLWSTVDLNFEDVIEALQHNEEHWVSREEYEKASEARDLINIYKNKYKNDSL